MAILEEEAAKIALRKKVKVKKILIDWNGKKSLATQKWLRFLTAFLQLSPANNCNPKLKSSK